MNFSLPLNGSHTCLFWCWAHIQTHHVQHRAGTFPAPALSQHKKLLENKEWEEGEGDKSQPRRVLELDGEVWALPGHCSPWAELQALSPWYPRRAGRVEKFPKLSSEKEKLFLCPILLGQRAGGTGCYEEVWGICCSLPKPHNNTG